MQDKKVIRTSHDLYNWYHEFDQFLAQFAADADFDIFDVEYTINRSYGKHSKAEYQQILLQANEILAMEPFPYDAIEQSTLLLISEATNENQKSEEVKQWLRNVIHLLELRVTGKL